MFNFFHSIIAKIAVGISSVALFFSGAATTPPVAPQDATSSAEIVVIATSSPMVATSKNAEANAKQDTPNEHKDSLIDSLKKQVADLTQKANQPSQQKVEAPKTSVITLPSGAVVEMDASGNVIRTITAAPQQTYTALAPTTQNQQTPPPVVAPAQTSQPAQISAPSCTGDTWSCDDWSACSAPGNQTRSCAKTYDCPSVNTPSPAISQTCTLPTPQEPLTEIVPTQASENSADYTFYNRTNKYIGYTSAVVKVWQSKIVNSYENVRIEVYLGGNMVSPIGSSSGTGNFTGSFVVPASTISGTTEDTATTVTVPLPNETGSYCNYCGHMVIPTARASYPKDVAAYIHLETHADNVDNPNDRYFVKLVSFEGETFGAQPAHPNSGGTIYTF